jgi:hypothetical protein
MELYNLIILALQMYYHRKHLLTISQTLFVMLLHRADRSPALAAMTLRSRILGSSNGDVILDESNSLAGHRLSNRARNVFEENYMYSPFEAALDLAVRSVSKARLLARCVPLSV